MTPAYVKLIYVTRSKKRLRSHLVLQHSAQVQFMMGTNVNKPFSKYPSQNSGTLPEGGYKVSSLSLGNEPGTDLYRVPSFSTQHHFVLVP